MAQQIPRKLFYKISEVCQITDTQPYVLRFWESEFSQLAPTKNRSGQRLYRRKDIDLVMEIKRLLNDEGVTIAGARRRLGAPNKQESIVEFLEPPESRGEPQSASTLKSITTDLEELLRIMDETDRRIQRQGGSRET